METAWKTGGDKNTRVINYNWGVCDISTPYDQRRVSESNSIHLHHHVPEMCLKLGKMISSSTTTKRGNPRCQVEGCHVTLGDAKDYYRKHKVCELHSKAPKVMVTGVLQRFCQQCSRFHGVTEFDEAKRSCRRRLKGHNQRRRRRKGTNSIKLGCAAAAAYSLLSSPDTKPADDLPSRCSPALYELIVANRATSISAHISNQNGYHQSVSAFPDTHMWDRMTTAATVDLKQAPALEFGLLSVKEKSKDPEEWTDYCWSSFGGANAV